MVPVVVVVTEAVDEAVAVHPSERVISKQFLGGKLSPPVDRSRWQEMFGTDDILPQVNRADLTSPCVDILEKPPVDRAELIEVTGRRNWPRLQLRGTEVGHISFGPI